MIHFLILILIFLEVKSDTCPPLVRVEGSSSSWQNGIYNKITSIHGKPVYKKNDRYDDLTPMIWYNGMFGEYANWLVSTQGEWDAKRYTWGSRKSNDMPDCPNLSPNWQEWLSSEGYWADTNMSVGESRN